MPASLRDEILALIGGPTIPPHWRGRVIGLYGDLTAPDPSPDALARGRDLVDAAELYHRVWALHCRVEAVVFGARNEPEDLAWRADAVELLDQWGTGRGAVTDLGRIVADNIHRLAKRRGAALAHLADRAGIGRTTLWRLLDVHGRGASDPRLSTVAALAAALKVEAAELLRVP